MRKIEYVLLVGVGLLILLAWIFPADAGSLNIKAGTVKPHSSTSDRCSDPGYSFAAGYDLDVLEHDFNRYLGFNVGLGGELTYMNYTTSYREKADMPRSDTQRESSVNFMVQAKPSISIWMLKAYLVAGVGPDWSESDGLDPAYMIGHGVELSITDSLSVGFEQSNTFRNDTGRYQESSGFLKLTF